MKSETFQLLKYEADVGKVFDWKDPRFEEDPDGNRMETHLYAKMLFLSTSDSIDNYIEIEEPVSEELHLDE